MVAASDGGTTGAPLLLGCPDPEDPNDPDDPGDAAPVEVGAPEACPEELPDEEDEPEIVSEM